MTEVTTTAETFTEEGARALFDQIRRHLSAGWELMVRAYQGRAWATLGYSSWEECCRREFHADQIRLPPAQRAEIVAGFRDAGMSTRAIGAALGADQRTVRRDLAGAAIAAPETVTGTDGKRYPAHAVSATDEITSMIASVGSWLVSEVEKLNARTKELASRDVQSMGLEDARTARDEALELENEWDRFSRVAEDFRQVRNLIDRRIKELS